MAPRRSCCRKEPTPSAAGVPPLATYLCPLISSLRSGNALSSRYLWASPVHLFSCAASMYSCSAWPHRCSLFSPPPSPAPSSLSVEFLSSKLVSPDLLLESSASPGKGKADFAGSAPPWSMRLTLPSCGRLSSHLRHPSPPSPYAVDGDRSAIGILNPTALTPLRRWSSSDAQNVREALLDRATRNSEFPR